MNKLLICALSSLMTVSAFASEVTKKSAVGLHFYDNSKPMLSLVQTLSNENKLSPVTFTSLRKSQVTKYRVLTFTKDLDASGNFRVEAYRDGNESKIYEKVNPLYTAMINTLIRDMQNQAHMLETYSGSVYERGGVYYGAKNLPAMNSISLVCKTENYRDGSGTASCFTRAENIDLTNDGLTFIKHSSSGTDEVDSLPKNGETFKTTQKFADLSTEMFKIN